MTELPKKELVEENPSAPLGIATGELAQAPKLGDDVKGIISLTPRTHEIVREHDGLTLAKDAVQFPEIPAPPVDEKALSEEEKLTLSDSKLWKNMLEEKIELEKVRQN